MAIDKSLLRTLAVPSVMIGITVAAGAVATIPISTADTNDDIVVTVDSACTMGQTVTSAHTTQLNPGETNSTIGESRIAAYCNDTEGYAIYAIGYTNGEYGNTNLVSTNGNNTIATGTSGTGSYWNMKLTAGTGSGATLYTPSIVSPFTTNTAIPDDYTKVAYRDSVTPGQTVDPATSGSYFTTTYQAHVSTTQPAGVYNGQVQYVVVHPSTAPAPEKPKTIADLTYMQDFATLTAEDKTSVLNSMPEGQQFTLEDSREPGKSYYIAKLKDGNVWMTQNLDLDIKSTKTYTPADTDIPANWRPVRSTTTSTTWDTSTTGNVVPHSYDPGNLYWNGAVTGSGGYLSNRTVSDPSATSGGTHYHIGNYYNWTAAVAMNNSSSYTTDLTDVDQSICPAGWRLPTYSGDKSFLNLQNAHGFTSDISGNIKKDPTYFVYGSAWVGSSSGVGNAGICWSSVVNNSDNAYQLGFGAISGVRPQKSFKRGNGFSIRCVAR